MTRLCVVREIAAGEKRVAVVPGDVPRLTALGLDVIVEAGAGSAAGFADVEYTETGAALAATRRESVHGSGVIAMIGPPSVDEVDGFDEESALVSFLPPITRVDVVERLQERRITAFSFDLVPRTSRAQLVDALSSQAGMAGYQAAVMAAGRLPRLFPMMMTAAGTIPPARVLVLGAGVAGLQAIATARRLGAVVSAYDIRPEAAEEIRSLGATALELPLVAESGQGGYAAAQADEFVARQQQLLADAVGRADVVITTAAVPDRPAPRLVSAAMVDAMRTGSVIVDLASRSGGNCDLTVDGTEVNRGGVVVIGAGDLASDVAASASSLYSRNMAKMLELVLRDGAVQPDFDDDVVAATCVTHAGVIRHEPTRLLTEAAPR
jgi:H+-translocating NAD(P) transhydrogenase subunit alpha